MTTELLGPPGRERPTAPLIRELIYCPHERVVEALDEIAARLEREGAHA